MESRAFAKPELDRLLEKIIAQCLPGNRNHVAEIILNERFHYRQVNHGQHLLDKIWEMSLAIREHRVLEITYRKADHSVVSRTLEPWGLIFSEYYFYLIAYVQDSGYDFPAIYRIDRIQSYQITDHRFHIPEANRFEEGESRKKVQFMRAGKLMRITFSFWGSSLEAVMDRLPNANVIKWEGNKAIVEALGFRLRY